MKTKEDVQRLMAEIFVECQKTREKAHSEYAHTEDALANFKRTGNELSMPPEKVWYIFAKKHWDGVLAWIRGYRSQREDVRGRIKDLIVYLVLLWAMVDELAPPKEVPPDLRFGSLPDVVQWLQSQGYVVTEAPKKYDFTPPTSMSLPTMGIGE
jgi:hypothetical protein